MIDLTTPGFRLASASEDLPPEDEAPKSEQELLELDIIRGWEVGDLAWILREHQLDAYEHYRAWEKRHPREFVGRYKRLYGLDWGKRVGKTSFRVVVRFEDCIRHPGRKYRYVSAYQTDIEEIVDEVAQIIIDGGDYGVPCPEHLKPIYHGKRGPNPGGFYFPNGSILVLAGLDANPDALRGRGSFGDDVSEAAFVRKLGYTLRNVLYHQYQQRPQARMCIESSAPTEEDTEYDKEFLADCKKRGAYSFKTIDDNTAMDDEEREEFIEAAGGRDDPECQREYFCVRVRDPERTVIPEYSTARHVKRSPVPRYAHCYTVIDPGVSHLCGVVWVYWDWAREKLVSPLSWAKANASTSEVAAVLKAGERLLWGGKPKPDDKPEEPDPLLRWHDTPPPEPLTDQPLMFWDGKKLCPNPFRRFSDVDARLILDLGKEHRVHVMPTDKDDKDAARQNLRDAFLRDKIEIWPDSGPLADHVNHARWNERRTAWVTHPVYGHFDCLAALIYAWRNLRQNLNPNAPDMPEGVRADDLYLAPELENPQRDVVKKLNVAMGGGNRWRRRR